MSIGRSLLLAALLFGAAACGSGDETNTGTPSEEPASVAEPSTEQVDPGSVNNDSVSNDSVSNDSVNEDAVEPASSEPDLPANLWVDPE